ncbi:aspartate 1-decarboxylase [candidate division KSB1 bacterium]|nr:aspartate 1-decarboxylase [candidate division KSB1 bacterium]
MQRILCKSKIHRATVTDTQLNYQGSLTVDTELLKKADILPYEQVQVVNINNGSRAETYILAGKPGSGEICVNGALARWAQKGDLIIIISYGLYDPNECSNFKPLVVQVDQNNHPIANINIEKPV